MLEIFICNLIELKCLFFFMCSLFIINIIIGVRAYAPFAVTIKKKLNSIKF